MKEKEFFRYGNFLVPVSKIDSLEPFVLKNTGAFAVRVYWKPGAMLGSEWSLVWDQAAVDLIMRFGPQVLEGNPEFKFAKRAWMFHNLVAHPLMQILALFGFTKLGLRIHDATIPKPKVSA